MIPVELEKDREVIDGVIIIEHLRFGDRNGKRHPKGGVTQAIVTLDDGRVFKGIARCSPRDNFNRKLGRVIATGRALKKAKLAGYTVSG